MAHPVIHFEVGGPDATALQQYYSELFGWTIDADNPMNYGTVSAVEPGIAGGVGPTPDGGPHVTFYVGTDDLQASLDKAEQLGGRTVMPPMDIPDGPSIAHFADPQGNVIGLVKDM
jgi:predicted enzyme related to lactoylglutathione lyase